MQLSGARSRKENHGNLKDREWSEVGAANRKLSLMVNRFPCSFLFHTGKSYFSLDIE